MVEGEVLVRSVVQEYDSRKRSKVEVSREPGWTAVTMRKEKGEPSFYWRTFDQYPMRCVTDPNGMFSSKKASDAVMRCIPLKRER